jgi:hypothetical protein
MMMESIVLAKSNLSEDDITAYVRRRRRHCSHIYKFTLERKSVTSQQHRERMINKGSALLAVELQARDTAPNSNCECAACSYASITHLAPNGVLIYGYAKNSAARK